MSKPDQPDTVPDAREVSARPVELEDWLNANIYHPLSYRLAQVLQHTIITPNAVSILGGLLVVIAAVVYWGMPGAFGAGIAFLLHLGWHVFDGADGDLARMTNRTSALGEVIDGACDYIGHIILYLFLAAVLAQEMGWTGGLLMVLAGLARAVQTVFFETQRRQYQFWVYGVPWLRVSAAEGTQNTTLFSAPARFYLWLSSALAAGGHTIDGLLERMTPASKQQAQIEAKRRLQPVIERFSILSSNYRTLVIGGAMIVGDPIIIVIFELCALSVLLIYFWQQAQREISALALLINGLKSGQN
ncbi:MAG: CDP-alcohol phosphatidyltransferase family protein [Erythrobacter sp.]